MFQVSKSTTTKKQGKMLLFCYFFKKFCRIMNSIPHNEIMRKLLI